MRPLTTVQLLFSASDAANANINFDVDVNAAFARRFSECEFNLGGKAMEARQGVPLGGALFALEVMRGKLALRFASAV
jgi:hypothetical protein